MKPKLNIIDAARRVDPRVVEVEGSQITFGELGLCSSALGGILLKELPRDHNIGMQRLVGGFRGVDPDSPTGPMLRRAVLNSLTGTRGVALASLVNTCSEATGATTTTMRKQVSSLREAGLVEHDDRKVKIPKKYAELIDVYTDLLHDFQTNTQSGLHGIDYIKSMVSGEHRDSATIPYLVKRAVVQSGKSNNRVLDSVADDIRQLFEAGETVTTADIARRTGIDNDLLWDYLQRIERTMNGTSPLVRIGEAKPGKTKVKQRTWLVK